MIIVDTDVLSALMRVEPEQPVLKWLDRQPRDSVWTTAVTVFEVRFGVEILPPGRRRAGLAERFDHVVRQSLQRRIAEFDAAAAEQAALLMAERRREGRSGERRDTMIAGIAIARRATLATRNTRHFADLSVPVVDPWNAAIR